MSNTVIGIPASGDRSVSFRHELRRSVSSDIPANGARSVTLIAVAIQVVNFIPFSGERSANCPYPTASTSIEIY